MNRSNAFRLFTVSVLVLLVAVFVSGCGKKSSVVLGPMPSKSILPDKDARWLAGNMREWLQNMDPRDAATLNNTGHLVFSWEKLNSSDPKHAHIADEYSERKRISFAKAFKKPWSAETTARLGTHHYPDTVEFEKLALGKYRVVIRSRKGLAACYVEVSASQ